MRIISGQWRGRTLVAPKGDATRPTADRTREALFSMLVSRLGSFDGLAVADLFAGSGALGFEALSRGAASCLFVEQDRAASDALRANAEKLGFRPDLRIQSVLTLGVAPQPLDLIMMDPPYGTGAGAVALDKLARLGWTNEATLISIETSKAETVDVAGFETLAQRDHGKARITLLRAS
ncbi:MAG: 16S rRNA (guanine(966)-N(2))-methyltransferase RsmD [Sphingomonadales bacterium]|jgi:16S rRNA (guanine966-N2)-methyltransferase|nr:16S rRNA (guanine(966)-N(2))-methyltransferase RsmD [Sphingomonadales bacterium]